MEPRQGQVGAKRGQQGQDRAKMRPICGQEGPRWGQEESKIGQDGAKTRPRGGQKGALKPARKTLKKRSPGSLRFGPQNGVRNLDFSSQKIRFSEQTRFQKTNPQKTNKERPRPGAILLPSVAPEGTPPAVLLKKLAFGIRPLRARTRHYYSLLLATATFSPSTIAILRRLQGLLRSARVMLGSFSGHATDC